ncbi:MAG: NAD(P)H-dependent oxidoreductase subunit E [Clostridiales bacterium]
MVKILSSNAVKEIESIAANYKDQPEQLMSILLDIQNIASNGFSKEVAEIVGNTTGIPESQIYDYITFYQMFSTKPRGKYIIRMCKSAPCMICGSQEIMDAVCDTLQIKPGETTKDGMFTLEFCECIGLCDESPAVMINDEAYTDLTVDKIKEILLQYQKGVV